MDIQLVMQRIGHVFTEHFHIETPAADTDLLESGTLDSLQFVELLAHIEEQFGFRLEIEDIDLEDLRTLARMSRLISTVSNSTASSAAA